RQHEKGKLLARERIEYLLDPGSFQELDMLARHRAQAAGLEERPYTDGVITGWGTIDGRKVFVFAQDFTVFGGALGEVFAEKIHKMMDMALRVGGLNWTTRLLSPVSGANTSMRTALGPTAAGPILICTSKAPPDRVLTKTYFVRSAPGGGTLAGKVATAQAVMSRASAPNPISTNTALRKRVAALAVNCRRRARLLVM
ncbi:MAG: carboxyl transferase domain-containing protein, partial [Actinomycetota bacterium]